MANVCHTEQNSLTRVSNIQEFVSHKVIEYLKKESVDQIANSVEALEVNPLVYTTCKSKIFDVIEKKFKLYIINWITSFLGGENFMEIFDTDVYHFQCGLITQKVFRISFGGFEKDYDERERERDEEWEPDVEEWEDDEHKKIPNSLLHFDFTLSACDSNPNPTQFVIADFTFPIKKNIRLVDVTYECDTPFVGIIYSHAKDGLSNYGRDVFGGGIAQHNFKPHQDRVDLIREMMIGKQQFYKIDDKTYNEMLY